MAGALGPRYDQATQAGRLRHFMDITDPRCLAPSIFFGMPFEEAKKIMDQRAAAVKQKATVAAPSERDWLAKKIVDARVHPDTGEIIPAPFRMSGFAVYGTPIIVGLLLPNPAGSVLQVALWQTMNQTHNALVNYSNRNASIAVPTSDLVKGYAGAVTTSVGLALGLTQLVKRSAMSVAKKAMVSRFIAYPSVASASVCNLVLMRQKELADGIEVKDSSGVVHGSSKVAAKQAVKDTALTRVVLPLPLLTLPPIINGAIVRFTPLIRKFPRARIPLEAFVACTTFIFALPVAVSLFPQEGVVETKDMEPEFRDIKTADGQAITKLFYNKGL